MTGGDRRGSPHQLNFESNTWLVAASPTLEQTFRLYPYVWLRLEEPGTRSALRDKKSVFYFNVLWPLRCALCLLKWVFCWPCAFVWKFGWCAIAGAKRGADAGAALLGEVRDIHQSGRVDWKAGAIESERRKEDDGGEGDGSSYRVWTEIESTDKEGTSSG